MCINPTLLDTGQLVDCRKCWQCLDRQVNDWVGRCIAETHTVRKTHSVTLTYGPDENDNPDHIRAAILTYSDVQNYLKYLRAEGFPCRYLVVGEYGKVKKRAHWHILIFWMNQYPRIEKMNERINEKHWKHGYSFFEEATPDSIRYICKYIQKDADKLQYKIMMSKYPPIGHRYLMNRAQMFVKQGLAPQSLSYNFPDVLGRDRKPKQFYMTGTTAENFLTEFCVLWADQRPEEHIPASVLVEEFLDSRVPEPDSDIGKMSEREREFREAMLQLKWRQNGKKKVQDEKVKDLYDKISKRSAGDNDSRNLEVNRQDAWGPTRSKITLSIDGAGDTTHGNNTDADNQEASEAQSSESDADRELRKKSRRL